jgi:hypothetical protein
LTPSTDQAPRPSSDELFTRKPYDWIETIRDRVRVFHPSVAVKAPNRREPPERRAPEPVRPRHSARRVRFPRRGQTGQDRRFAGTRVERGARADLTPDLIFARK